MLCLPFDLAPVVLAGLFVVAYFTRERTWYRASFGASLVAGVIGLLWSGYFSMRILLSGRPDSGIATYFLLCGLVQLVGPGVVFAVLTRYVEPDAREERRDEPT
jgi:hypothetical protein